MVSHYCSEVQSSLIGQRTLRYICIAFARAAAAASIIYAHEYERLTLTHCSEASLDWSVTFIKGSLLMSCIKIIYSNMSDINFIRSQNLISSILNFSFISVVPIELFFYFGFYFDLENISIWNPLNIFSKIFKSYSFYCGD